MTVHFINENWELISKVLQTRHLPVSHTSEELAHCLTEAFEEWGIANKHISGTTDNAKNIINAWGLLEKVVIGCIAHTLNLAAKKALEVPQASKVVAMAKRLVSHFHYSCISSQKLTEKQKQFNLPTNKLLQDVDTRWNSTYDMITRILEQRVAIGAFFLEAPSKLQHLSLDKKDISVLTELAAILEPLKDITVKLSGQSYATVSTIAPTVYKLLNKHTVPLENDATFAKNVKKALHDSLATRYQNPDVQKLLNKAAFLDPRFRYLTFIDQDEKLALHEHIKQEMLAVVVNVGASCVQVKKEPGENQPHLPMVKIEQDDLEASEIPEVTGPPLPNMPSSLVDQPVDKTDENPEPPAKKRKIFDLDDLIFCAETTPLSTEEQVSKELDRYLKESIPQKVLTDDHFDPLQWWRANHIFFPRLAKIAKRVFCVTATSTPSERVFSSCGNLVSKKRAMLKPETVDKLIFLHSNYEC